MAWHGRKGCSDCISQGTSKKEMVLLNYDPLRRALKKKKKGYYFLGQEHYVGNHK